ncbi:MAG: chemotaxis protein CheW [Gammaproteobacteria bacterium]|nr:chemotaxis protein CheW [Gammaproteobacteria bacterium]
MSAKSQFCTFFLNGLCFGIETSKIQEVMKYLTVTRVPLASPIVRGLINLRGQIVTAVDLRRRLEFPDREAEALPMNIVLRTANGAVSLLVDRIGDVIDVDEAQFEMPPETVSGVARELIKGAYKLPDRLLLVLDSDRVIDLA